MCSLAVFPASLLVPVFLFTFRRLAQANEMSRVYIGRLSYRAREKDVERFFKGYGKILEVDLKNGYGTERTGDNGQAARRTSGGRADANEPAVLSYIS